MTQEELNQLIATDAKAAIVELQKGRNDKLPDTEKYKEQINIESHDVMSQLKRPDKFVKRDPDEDDLVSENTINVNGEPLQRDKKRIAVCRIPLALQRVIVDRAVAFAFGNPVKLTPESDMSDKESEVMKAIKAVMSDAKTKSGDRRMARTLFSCTEVAELWYTQEKPTSIYGFDSKFKLRNTLFSPMKGDRLYPYFDDMGDMLAFSREYTLKVGGEDKTYFETWTADAHYRWVANNGWKMEQGFPVKNPIGKIPVIYAYQPEVEWAAVQPLINRLETLLSNFGDTNDYHAAPKLLLTGEIRGFSGKGECGAVIEADQGATAQYVSWQQAPESVKLEIETLLRMIYTLTQTPDISWDSVRGLNVSGVSLKLLFMDAHLKVQNKAEIFDEYMQRRVSVVKSFLAQMNSRDEEFTDACESLAVCAELEPYMVDDWQTLITTLLAANGQKPLMSQKTAIAELGWAGDVDAELEQIKKEESTEALADLLRQQEPTI